jgi:PD-(D/E)XK nuclease superfamily protein
MGASLGTCSWDSISWTSTAGSCAAGKRGSGTADTHSWSAFVILNEAKDVSGFEEAPVGQGRMDLIVAKQIVVELKAVGRLRDVHYAQLKSYLRATSHRVGLLFNFNAPTLTTKRMLVD